MDALIEQVEPTDGRYSAGGSKFKLWDHEQVNYDFERFGHNYQSMSRNIEQDPTVDAYIVEVTQKVATNFDKDR